MLVEPAPLMPARMLRLPARGGGALFLEAHWGPAGWLDLQRTGLVLDIGLLDPTRYMRYQSRPCSEGTLERLAAYLLSAASESHPDRTLPDFQDMGLGLLISSVTSDDFDVELEIQVAQDVQESLPEYDGLIVRTTRAALVSASQQVPLLEGQTRFPQGRA